MPRSYAILVEYNRSYMPECHSSITLHVNTDSQNLGKLLAALDASEAVMQLSVTNTISLPALHKLTKLKGIDLALTLEKLK